MKKNFFQIVLGTIAVAFGFSSCEKEKVCVKCATYKPTSGEATTYCQSPTFATTDEAFEKWIAELKQEGYTVTVSEKCEEK